MGQGLIKGFKPGEQAIPQLLDETQIFATWTITDVRELYRRFQKTVFGFALVEAQFESILSFKESVSNHVNLETLFEILDNDHDGRIDGLEFLGGLALCCQGTFEEKAKFCFEMYDFNLNAEMSKKEMTMMIMASICGMNLFTGGSEALEPSMDDLEEIVKDAFVKADRDRSGLISYEEFVNWARGNRDLMAGLETLSKLALDAKLECVSEDSAESCEEGELSDRDDGHPGRGVNSKSGKDLISPAFLRGPSGGDESMNAWNDYDDSLVGESKSNKSTDIVLQEQYAYHQWRGQIFEPTNFTDTSKLRRGPGVNLSLNWAYGYRSQNYRNNLHYLITDPSSADVDCIVYPTASLGIVYSKSKNQQHFYQGHTAEITCLALHPTGRIVVTGDAVSQIHLWKAKNRTCSLIIQGLVKNGVKRLEFSPNGDRLCAVFNDTECTVTLYKTTTGEIVASSRGIPAPACVHGIAYAPSGDEICLVGTKQIKFFTSVTNTKRALEVQMGRIGKIGVKQTFFCVSYMHDDAIVGAADGCLYKFHNYICVQVVQAHTINEPILSIHVSHTQGILVTGGKDCLVKSWDNTLNEIGQSIDMSEDLDGDGRADCGTINGAITSVEISGSHILIGTKGSDIFEATVPMNMTESLTVDRIAWGHCEGKLYALAVHPLREEFATSGEDKTLRIWGIRQHEQLNLRQLPVACRSLAYNPSGDVLCMGMDDGSVSLVEANTLNLRVYISWRHSMQPISIAKFSPDGSTLAIASEDHNLYLYRRNSSNKYYVKQAVCQGHSGIVRHVDFSNNSQYIASCCDASALLYWDTRGNLFKDPHVLRDETWQSKGVRTAIYGWAVQGLGSQPIQTLCAMPDVGDIVTGDTDGNISVYRYPCLKSNSLYLNYSGHAGTINNIAPSPNKRYMISIGKDDRTIILWNHIMEINDDSDDEVEEESYAKWVLPAGALLYNKDGDSGIVPNHYNYEDSDTHTSHISAGGLTWEVTAPTEVPEIAKRTKLQQAVITNADTSICVDILKSMPSYDETVHSTSSWTKNLVEPTSEEDPPSGTTDVDFELSWVHGYRCHDVRNTVKYSSAGKVVYGVASIGVIFNKSTGKQQFLQAAHKDEVIGLASHPNGQYFATGEAGPNPIIVVWSAIDGRVLARIAKAHVNGVPLLTFNSVGNLLASIGMDDCNTLVVHDWTNGIEIMRTAVEKDKIFCLCYMLNVHNNEDTCDDTEETAGHARDHKDIVVTGGYQHLSFWFSNGQNVHTQSAIWRKSHYGKRSLAPDDDHWVMRDKETVLTAVSPEPKVCITGCATGNLILWYEFQARYWINIYTHNSVFQHSSAILSSHVILGAVYSFDLNIVYDNKDRPIATSTHSIHSPAELCSVDGSLLDDPHINMNGRAATLKEAYSTMTKIITGDRKGFVAIWGLVTIQTGTEAGLPPFIKPVEDRQYNSKDDVDKHYALICLKVFNARQFQPAPTMCAYNPEIRSICERDGVLLIGLQGSEIYEVVDDDNVPYVNQDVVDTLIQQMSYVTPPVFNTFEDVPDLPPAGPEVVSASDAAAAIVKANGGDTNVIGADNETEAGATESKEEKDGEAGDAETTEADGKKDSEEANATADGTTTVAVDNAGYTTPPTTAPPLPPAGYLLSTKYPQLAGPAMRCDRLMSGHSEGELWGLCAHPTMDYFFTSGDDMTLRCWSLQYHKLVSYYTFSHKSRALDILPTTGSEMAVGFNDASIAIINTECFLPDKVSRRNMKGKGSDAAGSGMDNFLGAQIELIENVDYILLEIPKLSKDSWVQEVKYSFDGSLLAVGYHDGRTYIYDVEVDVVEDNDNQDNSTSNAGNGTGQGNRAAAGTVQSEDGDEKPDADNDVEKKGTDEKDGGEEKTLETSGATDRPETSDIKLNEKMVHKRYVLQKAPGYCISNNRINKANNEANAKNKPHISVEQIQFGVNLQRREEIDPDVYVYGESMLYKAHKTFEFYTEDSKEITTKVSTYFIDDAGQPVEAVLDLSEGIMLKDPTVNALQPNITSATPLTSSLDMSKHNIRASLPLHPSTPNMHRSATDLMTNLEVENAGDHSEANKPDETVINNDGQLQSNKYDAVSDAAEGDENQDHSNDKNILSTSSETGSNADVDKKKIPQGSRVISITSADVTPTVSMSVRSLQATDLVVMIVDSRHTSTYYQQFVNPHNHSELRWHEGNNVSFYRDAWWSDWTTPYGWPVQGIWNGTYDGIDVITTARSSSWKEVPVLVAGDNFGRIRLFNYPSLSPNAPDKCYKGHFGQVNKVVFSHNDKFCMSIGGEDRCIFVWSTDILDEIRERNALQMDTSTKASQNKNPLDDDEDHASLIPTKAFLTPPVGEESLAVKPWKSAVREPSDHHDSEHAGEAPEESLELKFVYGYRGWDCRNNLGYAGSKNLIIYHIAAVGIVYNSDTHTQIHNTEHDDDIISLVCHPNGHSVATGEIGKRPKIVIWDAYTGVTIRVIRFHQRGVNNLAFSKDGSLLISAGLDNDRMVAVHNVATGALVGKGKAGKGVNIYCITVHMDKFVTGGKNHIKFWEMPTPDSGGGELFCKSGIYNNKSIKSRTNVSATFMGTDCVTGMSDGCILIWKERCCTRFIKAHQGAILSLCELQEKGSLSGDNDVDSGPRIISGGKDGQIHIWSYKFIKLWSMDLSTTTPLSSDPCVRAISTLDDRLLIGTKASEIYEVNLLTTQVHRLCQGHFDDRAELWGLAVHPTQLKFVTVGDDMTVRLWDAKNTRQISMQFLAKKARAVTYRQDGTHIAVACYDGHVKILNHDLSVEITEVAPTNSWIECIAFSPDSKILAVGSHDGNIYLCDTKTYSVRRICRGHSAFITNIDFSHDGKHLQSTSGAYELLFWNTSDGKQVKSISEVRDVKWETWTCTLGWPVQGIWPSGADNTDVNSCDRSVDGSLLATGDDFSRVKIFQYPVNKEHSAFKEYKGHSEHVPQVRFSNKSDDGPQYLYTVGGLDKAVMQFEVKKATKKNF